MPVVNHTRKRAKGTASKNDCHKFYVREHQRNMFARLIADPDYVEGDARCDKDIKWLEHLVAQADGRLNKDGSVNPLKASKRGFGR